MNLSNPIETIRTWIAGQPDIVRSAIHVMVGARIMDWGNVEDMEFVVAPEKHFEEWLEERIDARADDVIASSIYLRELIQFFVMDHFGSSQQWEALVEINSSIAEEFRAIAPQSDLVESIDGVVRTAPFHQKLWTRTVSDWNNLIIEKLSNDRLRNWKLSRDEE
jgi:hypothetical protein